VHEFPQVLCHAAPEIEEFGASVQGGEDAGVGGGAGEGEVDEAELADAGVGEDFPGAVTLWRTWLAVGREEGLDGRKEGVRGGSYHFEDEGDYFVRFDVAIVLEEVTDCGVDCFHCWRVPAYALVAGTDLRSQRDGRCGFAGEGLCSCCHDG
jgi:hypothetical protein